MVESEELKDERRTVYISLGTILNKNNKFYENCIKALKECNVNVIMSVDEKTDISDLGEIPNHIAGGAKKAADTILKVINNIV